MEVYINISEEVYCCFLRHLLPPVPEDEEALFVFADTVREGDKITFTYRDHIVPAESDFDYKSAWHIELSDQFRARLLKKAHELKASIIEFHSHIDQKNAKFSPSDWSGFADFVPHVYWRLQKRPYAAVVVTNGSFDALAWVDDPNSPVPVQGLINGSKILKPTSISFKQITDE